jgi:hypothetical protein
MPSQPYRGLFRIRYRDGSGRITEREIEAHQLRVEDGVPALDAFCRSRQADRTFVIHRIASMVNLETGEVVKSLAGVPIVSLESRRDEDADRYLETNWDAAELADAVALASKGNIPEAVALKILQMAPPDDGDGSLGAAALKRAIHRRFKERHQGETEPGMAMTFLLGHWANTPPERRIAVATLIAEALSQSKWSDKAVFQMVDAMSRELGLQINARKLRA